MSPRTLGKLRRMLVDGQPVWDAYFDQIYPVSARDLSSRYWTPVHVARVAASWLTAEGARRVLDVGAGVGKFCIVGALTTGVEFVGLERRPHLAELANWAATQLNAGDVRVTAADLRADIGWNDFAAYYFYNPFSENLFADETCIDRSVELSAARFDADVAAARALLDGAVLGTRVVTYHGLGGQMPAGYTEIRAGMEGVEDLACWIKTS